MPCYAVATAKALISNQAFNKYFTKDLLRQMIMLVAQETGIGVNKTDYSHANWVSDIFTPDSGMLGLGLLPDGSPTIAISTASPQAQAFADALKLKIGQVGAALLQNEIAQIIAQQGGQEIQTAYKPNGVAVLTFKA